jgi:hypothetical protein
MEQVIIGVVLAAFGGLLVPTIKTYFDRRRERFDTSSDLLETLAASLWTYWKLAMRIAYYGSRYPDRREEFETALSTVASGRVGPRAETASSRWSEPVPPCHG